MRPRFQTHRLWRAWNALVEAFTIHRRCRICGGDRFLSEWHRARVRMTPDGPDVLCFGCWSRYHNNAGEATATGTRRRHVGR